MSISQSLINMYTEWKRNVSRPLDNSSTYIKDSERNIKQLSSCIRDIEKLNKSLERTQNTVMREIERMHAAGEDDEDRKRNIARQCSDLSREIKSRENAINKIEDAAKQIEDRARRLKDEQRSLLSSLRKINDESNDMKRGR